MNHTLLAALFALVLSQDPATRRAPVPAAGKDSAPLIIPSWCKEKPGGSNNNIPFSWTPTRWQQIFAPEAFDFEGTLLLGGVRFRMAQNFRGQAGGTVELEVSLATTRPGLVTPSTVFDENVASDQHVVVRRQTVEVAEAKDDAKEGKDPLGIWDLSLTFEQPFKFSSNRGLVLEVTVFGNDRGGNFTFPLDAWPGDDGIARRLYAEAGQTEGVLGGQCLVTRFDVLARAGVRGSRPASRPASAPAQPESRASGR